MAGNYRKLKNGKWELSLSLGTDLTGKRIRKYKYVESDSIREVERLLAEFVVEQSRGDYNQGERLTLEEYAKLWLKDYAEKNVRARTLERYESMLPRINLALGSKKLGELKATHLIQFYNMLGEDGIRQDGKKGGLSSQTIKHHHTVLSSMLSTAVKWQLLKENVCERVSPPKATKEEKQNKIKREESIYTIEQTKDLLKSLSLADYKYYMITLLAIFTGFRRGEIMGLDWADVNFTDNTISISKSSLYTSKTGIFEDDTKTVKSNRATHVPKFITSLLREYKVWWNGEMQKAGDNWVDTDRLFIKWNGGQMHPDTISSWFPKFLKKNNLPHMNFHMLRHLHGSILLFMGMDLNSVADQLGHADTQMLIHNYSHNVRKTPIEVAEHMSNALLEPKSKTGGAIGGTG